MLLVNGGHDRAGRRGGVKPFTAVVGCVAAVGVLAPAAGAASIDKWWGNRLGEFDSNSWNTTKKINQALEFTDCSHNWAPNWGAAANVEVQLRERKSLMPDVVHGTWAYACNANDQKFTSGETNVAEYFFKFKPNVSARTDGEMTVHHSN